MILNQQRFLITVEMMRVLLVPALRQLTNLPFAPWLSMLSAFWYAKTVWKFCQANGWLEWLSGSTRNNQRIPHQKRPTLRQLLQCRYAASSSPSLFAHGKISSGSPGRFTQRHNLLGPAGPAASTARAKIFLRSRGIPAGLRMLKSWEPDGTSKPVEVYLSILD